MAIKEAIKKHLTPFNKILHLTTIAGFLAGMITYVAMSNTLYSWKKQLMNEGYGQIASQFLSVVLPSILIAMCVGALMLIVIRLFKNQENIIYNQIAIANNQEGMIGGINKLLQNHQCSEIINMPNSETRVPSI